jgi:hypothetical protein
VPKRSITLACGATGTIFLVKQWNSMLFDEPPEFWVLSGLQYFTIFFFPVDKAILETKRFPQMSRGGCNADTRLYYSPLSVGYVALVVAGTASVV